jgi:hypothetical protein
VGCWVRKRGRQTKLSWVTLQLTSEVPTFGRGIWPIADCKGCVDRICRLKSGYGTGIASLSIGDNGYARSRSGFPSLVAVLFDSRAKFARKLTAIDRIRCGFHFVCPFFFSSFLSFLLSLSFLLPALCARVVFRIETE